MPIEATDIKKYLSGGAGNTDQDSSLGGAISSTEVSGLFDDVASAEVTAGDVDYRCYYVRNTHPTLVLQDARIWIDSNTPLAVTTVDIGLGTSEINGIEQSIANEGTLPTNVSFSSVSSYATGLVIGDMPPGSSKAIWVRRTVTASAGVAAAMDGMELMVRGDTNP